MTTKTKALLGISLVSFAISLTGVLWGLFLPVGAIAFGLFMIFYILGKESALFDEEQRLRGSLAGKSASTTEGKTHEPSSSSCRNYPQPPKAVKRCSRCWR